MNNQLLGALRIGGITTALLILASACTPFTLQKPAQNVAIGGDIAVSTDIAWNKGKMDNRVYWTADGPELNMLMFMTDIKKKSKLKRVSRQKLSHEQPEPPAQEDETTLAAYSPDMTPLEIVEFVNDFIQRSFGVITEVEAIEAHQFAGHPGVRFEFTFANGDGLRGRGMGVGATIDEKLQLMFFTGVDPYYFDNYATSVESIFQSAHLDS